MFSRHESDEVLIWQSEANRSTESLIRRLLPTCNQDQEDRALAWAEWQTAGGEAALTRYVRARNNTRETDDDIIQDALLTAYLGVERGTYQPREGIPFTAFVVGIARNKIREARRRERRLYDLGDDEEIEPKLEGEMPRQPERTIERREQHNVLRRGLSRLPEARRQVIERYLIGESTGEIASHLSMSEALVRQHKCRGLRALQRDPQIAIAV